MTSNISDESSLADRLKPEHLPTTAELKTRLESESVKAKTKAVDLNEDPKARKEYTFDFNYTDARGKVWEGEFTHKIPTLAQRDLIDMLQARKKMNMPVESFSAMAANRHLMISHLEVCLTKRPDWANDLERLYDPKIIGKLYEEAASHEAYFLGWDADISGSES